MNWCTLGRHMWEDDKIEETPVRIMITVTQHCTCCSRMRRISYFHGETFEETWDNDVSPDRKHHKCVK